MHQSHGKLVHCFSVWSQFLGGFRAWACCILSSVSLPSGLYLGNKCGASMFKQQIGI